MSKAAQSPTPSFDLNAAAIIAAKSRSLTEQNPFTPLVLRDCDIGVIPLHAYRTINTEPGANFQWLLVQALRDGDINVIPLQAFRQTTTTPAPNVQWVLVLTPHEVTRPSLLFGVLVQNGRLTNVGWIQDGDAPTPAEVVWWDGQIGAIAQDLADMHFVAAPNW